MLRKIVSFFDYMFLVFAILCFCFSFVFLTGDIYGLSFSSASPFCLPDNTISSIDMAFSSLLLAFISLVIKLILSFFNHYHDKCDK